MLPLPRAGKKGKMQRERGKKKGGQKGGEAKARSLTADRQSQDGPRSPLRVRMGWDRPLKRLGIHVRGTPF